MTANNCHNVNRFLCNYEYKKTDYIVKSILIFFQIIAVEFTNASRTGEAEVNVKLRDLNDETPIFENDEYMFTVPENTPVGTSIGYVKANDLDVFDKVT